MAVALHHGLAVSFYTELGFSGEEEQGIFWDGADR
jgi:hypothetical protein